MVVVGLLRCWRAVVSRSCTESGESERATTGIFWCREARDATRRASAQRSAVQQEQEQGERLLVGLGLFERLVDLTWVLKLKLELAG